MKHINKLFFLTGIICCCSLHARSQTTAKPQTTVKPATAAKTAAVTTTPVVKGAASLIDTFFKKYKDDGTGPAIDYLFGTNKLFTDTAQIAVLKGKLDALRQTIGKYTGKELIDQKSASPSLVFYSYLVKHESQPLRFTFIFYKPQNDWVLYRFKYDDQMDTELETAGKINNKKP
jgi:hypothetical protein